MHTTDRRSPLLQTAELALASFLFGLTPMWVRERFLSLWTRYRGALFLTISSSRSECNRKADAFRRRFIRLSRMTLGGGYNTRPSSRSIGTSFGVYVWFWRVRWAGEKNFLEWKRLRRV